MKDLTPTELARISDLADLMVSASGGKVSKGEMTTKILEDLTMEQKMREEFPDGIELEYTDGTKEVIKI